MDAGTARDHIEDLMLQIRALESSFRVINDRVKGIKEQRDRYAERLFVLQTDYKELLEIATKHVCLVDCVVCQGLERLLD